MKFFNWLREHRALRFVSLVLAVMAAILAVAAVTTVTVDLGPAVRALAERQGSKQIERPLHIGRLAIRLLNGHVELEDLRIDGLSPGDRPFFTARHLSVALDWSTAIHREITIGAVEMTDWQMLVEKWEERHNFPKFTNDDAKPGGPKRFTTTLRYLRASRGRFTFLDHEAPWSIDCPNLDISIGNLPNYHGTATFDGGTVVIQDFVPFSASMKARFVLDGPRVHLDRIDLQSDGATTVATGDVDLAHWPEQQYQVKSRVDFPRMRRLFFKDEKWELTGEGDFDGTFHLYKGGRELAGAFSSPLAGVNDYRFPSLKGSLRWTPTFFEVTDASAHFYGGQAKFTYDIKPLGSRQHPAARFAASYADVSLAEFSDFAALRGLRFAGSATGRNLLEWPLGRFSEHSGDGEIVVTPPPGAIPMGASLDAAPRDARGREWGPFGPVPLAAHLPMAGGVTYRYGPNDVRFEGGTFATERTRVTFEGTTAYGERSRFAFHVTSGDWQESDQVLAGIITDFGSPTHAVAFGGLGEFDGTMTGAFRSPRVEGTFTGRGMRAWDTLWGDGSARIVVENGYVRVADGVVTEGGSEIRADGLFSLGYPRDDGGQEIDARIRVQRRDVDSLRHAFQIDDYQVSGDLSGEFHLTGQYERPIGFGGMTIDNGVAYGEPFQRAAASLRFDGAGVRLDGITIAKGTGTVNGAAFVGWDGTYSFNADGRRIPVERLAAFTLSQAPLSGVAEFTAAGNGTFEAPRYDVRFRVNDLFIAEEGVGQVTGSLALRGKELSGDIDAASPRLAITGTGRISLTTRADAEMTFRFHDSSLDPYVRLFVPRLSPFTTAVATGTIRIAGALTDVDRLLVEATVDTVDLRLFDYALRNAAPIRLALDRHQVQIQDLQLVGEDTRLRVTGTVGLHDQRIALQAAGDANLGVLQGFFRDVRAVGRAELTAGISGPLAQPEFSGSARISGGRLRHFALPNALDDINGTIYFDARGVRLDDLSATIGGGRVQFGGRIGFDGYLPDSLNVTARGDDMHLRYPEGVRSVVDADLAVRGDFRSPTLAGTVTVKNAVWSKRIDTPDNLIDLAVRRPPPSLGEPAATLPVKLDVRILVPSTLRIDNNLARLVANADLTLRGSYDRPSLLGHADIERGEVNFEGRRYRVTRGSMDFTNPARIDPFFDVEAETTVRVPLQTYHVTISLAGTTERLSPQFRSDPPLPPGEVLALLLGNVAPGDSELRALQNPNEIQTNILTTRATQAIASPISSEVGKVVEQTFGVDTFQLAPSFIDPYANQSGRLNPSARLTIGKRISDRVYLTYSRSLNSAVYDQIVLLEIDVSDRFSWILSRNENETYALEFRVRHTF